MLKYLYNCSTMLIIELSLWNPMHYLSDTICIYEIGFKYLISLSQKTVLLAYIQTTLGITKISQTKFSIKQN